MRGEAHRHHLAPNFRLSLRARNRPETPVEKLALPEGLFSHSPPTEGHTCHKVATLYRGKDDPANDGKCTTCEGCTPHRSRHFVARHDGTTHLVLRCSHCDGPHAHTTLKGTP